MRIGLTAAAAALGLFTAMPASANETGAVEGQILDTTCFGPCVEGMEPKPYTGEAKVIVTRLPSQRRVRALAPEADGRFTIHLRAGRYRLRIRIEDPCYVEDGRELRVGAGGDTLRPGFFVYNNCIK